MNFKANQLIYMKILRVISDLYPDVVGGMGIHGHEMSKDQSGRGHEVTVYTAKGKENNESKSGYLIERFGNIRIFGNAISLSLMLKLFKKRYDFDVIHAHSHLFFSTFACAAVRKLGSSPLVVTNHGLMSQTVPKWVNNLYNQTVARWIFKTADTVLCYTEEEKSQIVDWGIQPDKITVIHNGVDTDKFTLLPEKIKTPESYGLGTSTLSRGLNESNHFGGFVESCVFVRSAEQDSINESGFSEFEGSVVSDGLSESNHFGGFVESCVFVRSAEQDSINESGFSEFEGSVVSDGLSESSDLDGFVESPVSDSQFCDLLWVGRFIPGKGVGDLLDTFAIIHEKNPDCKLLMVGDGPQLGEMKNKIRELNLEDNITIKTFIPNSQMNQIYQKSSVFILTSLEEGVPRSILEAMASGLPVVCTALPQIGGVVKNGGIIIPPKDPQKFADSVLKILSNPELAENMGINGRKNVVDNFSWQETVIKTLGVYQSLIDNSGIEEISSSKLDGVNNSGMDGIKSPVLKVKGIKIQKK